MMRLLFISLIVLLSAFLFLQGSKQQRDHILPVFLRVDTIANAHKTKVDIMLNSVYKPTEAQLENLRADYSNLWAHLNHLYATNEVEAGKEYYTEDWFKQICSNYEGVQHSLVNRNDEQHHLNIINWASDGLVCTAVDSSVIFTYQYPDKTTETTIASIALVLLLQGDHWRIDAMRFINESATDKP